MKINFSKLIEAGFRIDVIEADGKTRHNLNDSGDRETVLIPSEMQDCTLDIYGTAGLPEKVHQAIRDCVGDNGLADYAIAEAYEAIERAQIMALIKS